MATTFQEDLTGKMPSNVALLEIPLQAEGLYPRLAVRALENKEDALAVDGTGHGRVGAAVAVVIAELYHIA